MRFLLENICIDRNLLSFVSPVEVRDFHAIRGDLRLENFGSIVVDNTFQVSANNQYSKNKRCIRLFGQINRGIPDDIKQEGFVGFVEFFEEEGTGDGVLSYSWYVTGTFFDGLVGDIQAGIRRFVIDTQIDSRDPHIENAFTFDYNLQLSRREEDWVRVKLMNVCITSKYTDSCGTEPNLTKWNVLFRLARFLRFVSK